MTLKITLTIDQESEQGTVLIGLLAKALGRGEAGVNDLRIERMETIAAKPKLSGIERKVAAEITAIRSKAGKKGQELRQKRGDYFMGMRAAATGKPNTVSVALRAFRLSTSRDNATAAFVTYGFNPTGLGAMLSKFTHRGLVKRVGPGQWQLTPAGEELDTKLNGPLNDNADSSQSQS